MQISLSIIDYIALKMGVRNLSDLHYMDATDRLAVCRMVEKINAEDESLEGWNDALHYLVGEPPAESQADARSRLIQQLCAV